MVNLSDYDFCSREGSSFLRDFAREVVFMYGGVEVITVCGKGVKRGVLEEARDYVRRELSSQGKNTRVETSVSGEVQGAIADLDNYFFTILK